MNDPIPTGENSPLDTDQSHESMEPGAVELRCGMCDGTGVEVGKDYACSWCDGLGTVEAHLDGKYVPAHHLSRVESERNRLSTLLTGFCEDVRQWVALSRSDGLVDMEALIERADEVEAEASLAPTEAGHDE